MRRFFGRISGGSASSSNSSENNTSSNQQADHLISASARGRGNNHHRGNNENQTSYDIIPTLIYCAAQTFSTSIEEILSDSHHLTGDSLLGFRKLLEILNDRRVTNDPHLLATSHGKYCLQVLIDHHQHGKFIEICNQVNLSIAFIHVLRLLRMLEIKKCKHHLHQQQQQQQQIDTKSELDTKDACQRICKIFRTLLKEMKTLELLRPSIIKLLTFPLCTLPMEAIHFQDDTTSLIITMCQTGFTSQQLWYLHDKQAIPTMIRNLSELVSIPTTNGSTLSSNSGSERKQQISSSRSVTPIPNAADTGNDQLLRGTSAEERGMWITGFKCIVEVIATSLPISTVLMSDFETLGGAQMMIYMLKNCAPARFMSLLNVSFQLLFDPQRPPEQPLPSITAGGIFRDFLLSVLGLKESITANFTIESLIDAGETILDVHIERSSKQGNDYIIQSFAYSLLTLYSHSAVSCATIEDAYHLLSTLVLSIPILTDQDSITAVLTTLSYVCLCVERTALLPLTALCAVCSVLVPHALRGNDFCDSLSDSISDSGIDQFRSQNSASWSGKGVAVTSGFEQHIDLIFSSMEAIMRSSNRYAMVILKCGLLRYVFCEPFEQLCTKVAVGEEPDVGEKSLNVFDQIVSLLLSILEKSAQTADEVRKSGLPLLVRNLIVSSKMQCEITAILVRLPEVSSRSDTSHLMEALDTIFTALIATGTSFEKKKILCDSLSRILLNSEDAVDLSQKMNGLDTTLTVLSSFEGAFQPIAQQEYKDQSMSTADMLLQLRCMESVLRTIAIQLALSSPHESEDDYLDRSRKFRENYFITARSIYLSNIFVSAIGEEAINLLIDMLTGFDKNENRDIIDAATIEIFVLLLPILTEKLHGKAVDCLLPFIESNALTRKHLMESGIVALLIQTYQGHFQSSNWEDNDTPIRLLRVLMSDFITVDTFVVLMTHLVRPTILPGRTAFRLLKPWQSFSNDTKHDEWRSIQFLLDVAGDNLKDRIESAPAITLGSKKSDLRAPSATTPSYINVLFSEASRVFPQNCFTCSFWVKVNLQPSTLSSDDGDMISDMRLDGASFHSNKFSSDEGERLSVEWGQVIPIISLTSMQNDICYIEAHLDMHHNAVRVIGRTKTGAVSVQVFNSPATVRWDSWTSVVICFKRTNRFSSVVKATLNVYLNGLPCTPAVSDTLTVESYPAQSGTVMHVGKLNMKTTHFTSDVSVVEAALLESTTYLSGSWDLGPWRVYDEFLSHEQAVHIFLKGPNYTGKFYGESPLVDHFLALSTHSLYRANNSDKTAEQIMAMMDIKYMCSVDMSYVSTELRSGIAQGVAMTSSSGSILSNEITNSTNAGNNTKSCTEYDSPVLPAPIASYSAVNVVKAHVAVDKSEPPTLSSLTPTASSRSRLPSRDITASGGHDIDSAKDAVAHADVRTRNSELSVKLLPTRYSLLNVADFDTHLPIASIEHGIFLSPSTACADCIAALGGPDIILPLLQAASTENQLLLFLRLLRHCVRKSIINLKYMQTCGYSVVAFLISQKPSNVISEQVVGSLIDLAADTTVEDVKASNQSIFLIDPCAFHVLILNHNVWQRSRFCIASSIVTAVFNMTTDERYSSLNSRRLADLGVSHWLLFIAAFSVSHLRTRPTVNDNTEGESQLNQSGWSFQYPSAIEMAEFRDGRDKFLYEATVAAQRIINTDIRKKDLDIMSRLVMFTFLPRNNMIVPDRQRRRSSSSILRTNGVKATAEIDGVSSKTDDVSGESVTQGVDVIDFATISVAENLSNGASPSHYPFCNYFEPTIPDLIDLEGYVDQVFTPMGIFRVYLLRLLYNVYDHYVEELRRNSKVASVEATKKMQQLAPNEIDIFEQFRKSCSTTWFLGVMQQSNDIATKSHSLRLMGLFLQKDAVFLKEFCAADGFKKLHTILTPEPQEIPVILPLVAILFRIPMQVMMHPFQIKSIANFVHMLDLEECYGPDCTEPVASELTIPLLSLLFDCITNAYRGRAAGDTLLGLMIDLLFGILEYAMDRLHSFRFLMQSKAAIEVLCGAMLSSSTAFNDYGTQIYSSAVSADISTAADDTNEDSAYFDLGSYIKSDYIDERGCLIADVILDGNTHSMYNDALMVTMESSNVRFIDGVEKTNARCEVQFTDKEGDRMQEMVKLSLQYAVVEFNNYRILCDYFISFPREFSDAYEYGFQKLLLNSFIEVSTQIIQENTHMSVLLKLSEVILYMIPLVKANLLYDKVMLELTRYTLILTRKASVAASNSKPVAIGVPLDGAQLAVKELGGTARLLALSCINLYHMPNISIAGELPRIDIFSLVRENLEILFHPLLDDSNDTSAVLSNGRVNMRASTSEGGGVVLDALQGLASSRPRVNVFSSNFIKSDRNSISVTFWLSMTNICYNLVLEDDAAVRIEATRILSYMSIHRRVLMEQLVGNPPIPANSTPRIFKSNSSLSAFGNTVDLNEDYNSGFNKEVDIFRDGFSKLVPNSAGKYELYLRGGTDDNDSEENRFADFSFWISDNSAKCDKLFSSIENSLASLSTTVAEIDEMARQLQQTSIFGCGGLLGIGNSSSLSSPAQRQPTTETNHLLLKSASVGSGASVANSNAAGLSGAGQQKSMKVIVGRASYVKGRAEDSQKLGEQIVLLLQRWFTFGYSSFAAGAARWKIIWNALQCGPIWGFMPTLRLSREINIRYDRYDNRRLGTKVEGNGSVTNAVSTDPQIILESYYGNHFTDLIHQSVTAENHSDMSKFSAEEQFHRGWRLSLTEGPERCRRKLEQDYCTSMATIQTPSSFNPEAESEEAMINYDILTSPSNIASVQDADDSVARLNKEDSIGTSCALPIENHEKDLSAGTKMGSDDIPLQLAVSASQSTNTSPDNHKYGSCGLEEENDYEEEEEVAAVRPLHIASSDVQDMQDFLLKVSKAGVIKRMDASNSATDFIEEDNIEHMEDELKINIPETSQVVDIDPENRQEDHRSEDAVRMTDDACDIIEDHVLKEQSIEESIDFPNSVSALLVDEPEPFILSNSGSERCQTSSSPKEFSVQPVNSTKSSIVDNDSAAVDPAMNSSPNSSSSILMEQTNEAAMELIIDVDAVNFNAESKRIFKSLALLEIIKGLVGPGEWMHGYVYEIHRIHGLEAYRGLLLITSNGIHFLSGFFLRHDTSSSHDGGGVSPTEIKQQSQNKIDEIKAADTAIAGVVGNITDVNDTTVPSMKRVGRDKKKVRLRSMPSKDAEFILDWVSSLPPVTTTTNKKGRSRSARPSSSAGLPGSPLISKEETLHQISALSDHVDADWVCSIWRELTNSDLGYHKMPLTEIYSFFKRRHQLKYTAMEMTDIHGYSILFSCDSVQENEELLGRLLQSNLPSSIFSRVVGLNNLQLLRNLSSNVYNRLIHIFVSSVTKIWQNGEISNFEYLIHINAAAGRSFQDLTQYPVFPWIIADYSSEFLDFDNPSTFRDLSLPMGALGERRAVQYRERYQTMDEFVRAGVEGSAPPFFYGTHYSCAGYVLHYLIRMQPYADMAIALQGNSFDKADRLFLSVENSWLSASNENLQDVRELIPEFYFLPDFLTNYNHFDLGITQRDAVVKDVILPPWAHGDPKEFIRIHREALESRYVSENLHNWIDLIFGFKQRGRPAFDAMNVFIHLTYEGEVDIEAITDPVMRSATISQINNFGQTPSKIFHRPHPKKIVPDVAKKASDGTTIVDPYALAWHGHLSPPLCVVGAPRSTLLVKVSYTQMITPSSSRSMAVGDIRILSRDKVLATPVGTYLIPPTLKRTIRMSSLASGVTIQPLSSMMSNSTRNAESDKDATLHENLHAGKISCLAVSKNGLLFATGSDDTTVKVWRVPHHSTQHSGHRISLLCSFTGHRMAVRSLDLCPEYSIVVSGGMDEQVCVWDYHSQRMLRVLSDHAGPVISVSMNSISGQIATLTALQIRLYSMNGELISFVDIEKMAGMTTPTTIVTLPCGLWQEGIEIITGHRNGHVHCWKVGHRSIKNLGGGVIQKYERIRVYVTTTNRAELRELYVANSPAKVHRADITSLRLSTATTAKKEMVTKSFAESRSLDLLVGDADGFVSRWTSTKLEQLSPSDLAAIIADSTLR